MEELTLKNLPELIKEITAQGIQAAYQGKSEKENPFPEPQARIKGFLILMTKREAWFQGFKEGKKLAKGGK